MKLNRKSKAMISEVNMNTNSVKDIKRGSIDPQINMTIGQIEGFDLLSVDSEKLKQKRVNEIFKAWYTLQALPRDNYGDYQPVDLKLSDSTVEYLTEYFIDEYEKNVRLDFLVYRAVDLFKTKEFERKGYKGYVLKIAKNAWNIYKMHDFIAEVGYEKLAKDIRLISSRLPMLLINDYPLMAIYNNIPLTSIKMLCSISYVGRSYNRLPKLGMTKDQIRKVTLLQAAFKCRIANNRLQSDLGNYLAGTNFCKGLSIAEFKHMIEGIKFWTNARIGMHINNVAPSFFVTLGKLNINELRYAAIHQMFDGITEDTFFNHTKDRYNYVITKRCIHWRCVKEVQDLMIAGKHRMVLNHESQPKARKFFKEHGVYIKSFELPELINIKALNAMKKAELHLVHENSNGFNSYGISAADKFRDCITVSNIFGMKSVEVVKKAIADEENWTIGEVHGFVNHYDIKPVSFILNQQWNQFFANNISLAKYAGFIKEDMDVFKSPEQFLQFVRTQRYTNVPEGFEHLIELCARHELSDNQFQDFVRRVKGLNNKTSEMLPFIRIDGSTIQGVGHQYTLEKLDADDPAVLLIGLDTSCCQHISGAGSSCALHSYEQSDSAIYVVRKNGRIVAQSWVWRNKENGVVFDSVEVNVSERNNYRPLALMFKELARELIGKLMIDSVYVGRTGYGMTNTVLETIGMLARKLYHTSMITPCRYMDGDYHYLVAASEAYVKQHLIDDGDISILATCC